MMIGWKISTPIVFTENLAMTIDEITAVIRKKFPSLETGPREPDGYSWWESPPIKRGKNCNRIFRAVAKNNSSPAEVKLAITNRLVIHGRKNKGTTVKFKDITKKKLVELVTEERRLYR